MTTPTDTAKQILHRMDMLTDLTEEELTQLARASRVRTYARREAILWAGGAVDCSFLFARGAARVYRVAANGRVATVCTPRAGDLLPEVSERANIDAAADGTVVSHVPRAVLLPILVRHPRTAEWLHQSLTRRLIQAWDLVEDVMCLDGLSRVARALGRLGNRRGDDVFVTREELGSMSGVGRQQVTVCLAELRSRGWIEYESHQPRQITLLEPDRLRDPESSFAAMSSR